MTAAAPVCGNCACSLGLDKKLISSGPAQSKEPRPRIRSAGSCSALTGLQSSWMRSEEHTSELQSLMRISSAVFCLIKTKKRADTNTTKKKYKLELNNSSNHNTVT